MLTRPSLGFGLGLRVEHYEAILGDHPPVDWLEALTENYLKVALAHDREANRIVDLKIGGLDEGGVREVTSPAGLPWLLRS